VAFSSGGSVTDSEVISKAIELLELLTVDGEYGTCNGCGADKVFRIEAHKPDCELIATIEGLKRLTPNTEG
jgi:hypothetical protein